MLPAYDNCSINVDYCNMTKFTRRADLGYGQVGGVLERWMKEFDSNLSRFGARHSESIAATDHNARERCSYNGLG